MSRLKVELDENAICEEYINTEVSIETLALKHRAGKIKIKAILQKHGIEIKKRGKQPLKETYVVEDYHTRKYENSSDFHYIVYDEKNPDFKSKDIDNKGGVLTTYIETQYGVKTPTLYDRRMHYMRTGNYWWEQWLSYRKVKNSEVIKCPYCDWETTDLTNKSWMLENHLKKVHNIDRYKCVEEHPEYKAYFCQSLGSTGRLQFETDPNKFVKCKICGRKLTRIDWRHLQNYHNMIKEEYIEQFGSDNMVCKDLHDKLSEITTAYNMKAEPIKTSVAEEEIKKFIKSFGIECRTDRTILKGKEIDIFIPSLNIGFEYDGIVWHTENGGGKDKNYHVSKTNECESNGVKLYHIFEDEYNINKNAVLNNIKSLIGIKSEAVVVDSSECTFNDIPDVDAIGFLEKYIAVKPIVCDLYFGAYYNNELVALQAYIQNGNNLELKYCVTNYNYRLKNVHKYLFQYLWDNVDTNIDSVIAYADRRWVLDYKKSIFAQIGMNYSQACEPRCTYYNSKVSRYNRYEISEFNKQHLCETYNQPTDLSLDEILINIGYDRIWDCGYFEYKYVIGKQEK